MGCLPTALKCACPARRLLFSYEVLTPAALNFFVSYADGAVESLWSIDQYFEFVLVLMLSTGLSFQVRHWPDLVTLCLQVLLIPGSSRGYSSRHLHRMSSMKVQHVFSCGGCTRASSMCRTQATVASPKRTGACRTGAGDPGGAGADAHHELIGHNFQPTCN